MEEAIRCSRWAMICLFALLASCAGGLDNGPRPAVRLDQNGTIVASSPALSNIRTAIASDCLTIPVPGSATKARRNQLATAYMFAVDLAYNEYERNLLDSVRENDLGAATASLGLSAIGSVVGNPNLATALSTANSIVTGTHTAIGRDYLLNQTMTTLQTQMRASRATQRALILSRLRLDFADWDSCTALSDVLAYEQAGTLNGALAAIAASAARSNSEGEAQVRAAIPTVAVDRGAFSRALEAFVYPADQSLWPARIEVARRVVVAKGLMPVAGLTTRTRLLRILNFEDADREADRRSLIQGIIDDPNVDDALKGPLRTAIAAAPAAIPTVAYDRAALSRALDGFVYPADQSLWPARIAIARRAVVAKNLMPVAGLTTRTRLLRILNFADPDREADRLALIQGILDDPNVDDALKGPLRTARGEVSAAISMVAYDHAALSRALEAFVYPADQSLWPARIEIARRVVVAKGLMPVAGLTTRTRLLRILNFQDPDREADRLALIRGILDDPNVDDALKGPLRIAIAQ